MTWETSRAQYEDLEPSVFEGLWERGFRFFCLTPKPRHRVHSMWSNVDWHMIWDSNFGDPYRQDKRMPGVGVLISSPAGAAFTAVRELAILPWNWADELMRRAREHGFTGRFFVPLPEPRWVNA